MRALTAKAIILLSLLLWAGCGDSNKKVVLRYIHDPSYACTYLQHNKQLTEIWESDTLVYREPSSADMYITQQVTRNLPDSSAEILETSHFVFSYPKKGDTLHWDTSQSDRKMYIYEMPNGRIVDLDFTDKSKDSASVRYLKAWYEQSAPVFPDTAIGINSKWTNSTTVEIDSQTVTASTSFEVKGFKRELGYDCIEIGYTGMIVIPIKSSPTDSVQRFGKDEIRVTGTYWFAYDLGIFVNQVQHEERLGTRKVLEKSGKWVDRKVISTTDVSFELKERKKV